MPLTSPLSVALLQILVIAGLCLSVAPSSVGLLPNETVPSSRFPRTMPTIDQKYPYYSYVSSYAVRTSSTANSSQSSGIYRVNFSPKPDLSNCQTNYFLGWVQNYQTSDGTLYKGYPNPQLKYQPIFLIAENTTTGKTSLIRFSSELPEEIRSFIINVVDHFSPAGRNNESYNQYVKTYRGVPVINGSVTPTGTQTLENVTTLERFMTEKSVSDDGRAAEIIELDADNFIRNYSTAYTFSLKGIDSVRTNNANFGFNGSTAAEFHVSSQFELQNKSYPSPTFIRDLQNTFATDTTVKTYTKEDLDKDVFDAFVEEVTNNTNNLTIPKPDIPGVMNISDKVSIQLYANAMAYGYNITDCGCLKAPAASLGGFPMTTVVPFWGAITAIKTPLPKLFTIYSYTKQLITQNVFGKTLTVVLSVQCTLTVYGSSTSSSNTIRCVGVITLSYSSNSKAITIFDHVKPAKIPWANSASYGGTWSFSLAIPLPPPVSFIQISFSFGIGYSVGVGYYISVVGLQVTAGAYANAALTASVQAGIKVAIVEGGVYLDGTIVSIKTEPKVIMALNPKSIDGSVLWQLTLNSFSFRWGLYYKKFKKRHELTSWSISQGKTSTWTIYTATFTIPL